MLNFLNDFKIMIKKFPIAAFSISSYYTDFIYNHVLLTNIIYTKQNNKLNFTKYAYIIPCYLKI